MEPSKKVSDIYLAAKELAKQNDLNKTPKETKMLKIVTVYPISAEESINYLAMKLKRMDLQILTAVIVCQDLNDCKWLQMMLEERDVNDILVCHDSDEVDIIKSCWPYLFTQKVMIISNDLISQLQLEDKTIDLLVIDNVPEAGLQNLSNDIIHLSHENFENENGNCTTTGPEPEVVEVSPQMDFKECNKNSGYIDLCYNSMSGIMVFDHWPFLYCRYITGVSGISIKIRKSMQNHFAIDKALREQRYAWPHLAYGHSMIMIGHEKCGKSWSYIPILCQRIYNAIETRDLEWAGPICIAVVVDMKECATLAKIMKEMLDFCSTDCGNVTQVVTPSDASSLHELSKMLCRPCGILIITVELLLELEQFEKPGFLIFDPMNLRSIVLDNLDSLRRMDPLKLTQLFKWLMNKFKFDIEQTQLIITSRMWMEELMRPLSTMLLIFEDGLEVSAYGGIKLDLKFVSDIDHYQGTTLLKKLSQCNLEKECIVVACHKDGDSRHLSELLSAKNIPHINYDSQNESIKKIENKKGIIIAIDHMLPHLKCGYIDLLICYTLTNGWHRYKARFNLFYTNCKTQGKRPGEALMFFNQMATEQAWLFCDFMMKHDLPIKHEWLDHIYNFRLQKEISQPLNNINLCTQLLSYGNCSRRSCRFRHQLSAKEAQLPHYLPSRGKIFFNILNCVSPTNMIVKPIIHHSPGDQKIYQNVCQPNEVHAFYREKLHRTPLENPSIGDICILKIEKYYQRAVVTGIVSDEMISVRLLDCDGRFMEVSKSVIYNCDLPFSTEMAQAIELRLTGIMPYSMDRLWTRTDTLYVRQKFAKASRDYLCNATIDFGFNNTLFVNTVLSDKGQDLREILINRMNAYDDKFVKNRFLDMLKDNCKDRKETL